MKKITFFILLLFLINISYAQIEFVNTNSNFVKENNIKVFTQNQGYPVFKNSKIKIYTNQQNTNYHKYSIDKPTYYEKWSEYRIKRDSSNLLKKQQYLDIEDKFPNKPYKSEYNSFKKEYAKNQYKINKFNSKGFKYKSSENYKKNIFY